MLEELGRYDIKINESMAEAVWSCLGEQDFFFKTSVIPTLTKVQDIGDIYNSMGRHEIGHIITYYALLISIFEDCFITEDVKIYIEIFTRRTISDFRKSRLKFKLYPDKKKISDKWIVVVIVVVIFFFF